MSQRLKDNEGIAVVEGIDGDGRNSAWGIEYKVCYRMMYTIGGMKHIYNKQIGRDRE